MVPAFDMVILPQNLSTGNGQIPGWNCILSVVTRIDPLFAGTLPAQGRVCVLITLKKAVSSIRTLRHTLRLFDVRVQFRASLSWLMFSARNNFCTTKFKFGIRCALKTGVEYMGIVDGEGAVRLRAYA